MSMKPFIVTKKSNIDENGNAKNEEAIGVAVSEHLVPFSKPGEEPGTVEMGVIPKVAVLWEHRRSPSPSYENPEDLHWLSIWSKENEEELEDGEDLDFIEDEDDGSNISEYQPEA